MADYSASNETNTSQELSQTYSFGGQTLYFTPKTTATASAVNPWLIGGLGLGVLALLALVLRGK